MKNSDKMKKDTEFQEIGKKIPYKVPEGFFDELSLKTLAEAKKRSESRRKFRILWQSVAVAASLTGLAFLGYYFSAPEKAVVVPVVAEQPKVAKPQVQEVQPEKMAEPQIVVAEKIEPEPNPEVAEENSKEDLSDLLAGLSDDDLLQMAAMIKTDPFMEEVPQ